MSQKNEDNCGEGLMIVDMISQHRHEMRTSFWILDSKEIDSHAE
jgi:hypothetical protein